MSADSQQIDITPYKVRRENVITSNQQRVWEPKPTTDLASSILDKLTEIRGNLYPTHLNIPPHRSIPSQSATPQGYSYLSTSLAPQETGALISNLDLLAKKDIYTHSDLSHSIDPSPTIISGESPLLESSHIGTNYQSLFETTAFKNVEIPPHKTTEAGTIPRIELNFASTNHYDHSSYLSKPALYEPMIAHSNTQPVTEFSSDFTSQTLSPTNLEKNILQVPSYFEHTKSNSAAGYSGTTFQVSDILKAGPSNIQDPTNTKNALYIPIARNTSYSPEPTLTNLENKSNPTSTRATQTRVHINTSTRLPSVRKTPSRAQLINSLNEALKMGHNETVDTKSGNVVQSRRFEKSVEIPKKTMSSADVGEKVVVKAKNKSTVVLANIIGQNQGMESKRFSFGQLNNEQSDGVPQSERSDYSQKDRDIQEFINNVSRNQVIRAQTLNLKKKAQNAASSSNVENSMKGTINRANSSIQTSNKNIGVKEVQTRSGGVDFQGQFHGEYKKSVSLDNQNKFQRESRKTLSMENATRDAGDQLRKEKRATPPLSNKYQEVNDGDHFEIGTKKDEVQEDNQSEYSEQPVQENRSQDATRRTLHFEDHVVQPFNQAEKTKSRSVTISQLENQPSERVSVVTQHEVQAEKPKSRGNARNLLEISQSEDKASVAFTKSRPMTRNHLDETRESGLEILQRNPGSRSGSSSPTRSTTPEGFLVKKLEQRNSESPIKNREVNVVSGRESCIEKSVYNEDQERFTEVKKAGNASDGSMSPNRRVLVESPERNSVAARRTQGQQERVEKSEEPEQSENVNSGAQTLNRPSIERNSYHGNNAMNQQMRVQRSPEVINSSPVRQNFRMVGSPVQVNGMNPGNMNNQMPAGFNVQVPTNYNFQGQMPNFENEASNAEYQKHIMMVMNYYQGHLNHMKNIIVQQNETINQERYKNQMYERKNAELTRTVQNLEQTIKNQGDTLDSNQKDLKTRYEVVMDELAALKRTMLATQLPQEVSQAPKSYPTEGKEYQNLLYHEILSLRKDLESQRSVMYDYRSSTRYLESQMKDLERMYMDEVKSNAQVSHKREQIKESLESYKKDFIKMDTLNQIILDGYERTRKDVNNMKKTQPEEEDVNRGRSAVVTDYQQNQARQRKDLYIASLSPPKYDVEANNQEMLRNKMRAEDCQMKSLMQWNNKNETNSVHYVAHGYMPSAALTSPDHQKQMFFQTNSSQNTYTRRGYSPQPNQSQRVIPTENKPNRSHAVFPSYQKMEDNREQIRRIDQTIVQLEQHKKFVENEIFKMPNIAKSLEQKRKKAGLEMELEGIENQIEECKHQLRQYDVLNTK